MHDILLTAAGYIFIIFRLSQDQTVSSVGNITKAKYDY